MITGEQISDAKLRTDYHTRQIGVFGYHIRGRDGFLAVVRDLTSKPGAQTVWCKEVNPNYSDSALEEAEVFRERYCDQIIADELNRLLSKE